MQLIINFFIKNKTFLWFLLLFCVSLGFTIQSHSYHKSKFINSANFLSGGVYGWSSNISAYFNLNEENKLLLEDNALLKRRFINSFSTAEDSAAIDSGIPQFVISAAQVYKNSYSLTNNYILINKGENDSVKLDLGVISSKGIIGIVDRTSNQYARILSILNTNSRINAQLKKSNHFGSLIWNTNSPEFVQLTDVPNFAPVTIGDTIITGGQSQIFPKGIPVGRVVSFSEDASGDSYTLEVKLFNDMTSVGHVYIIENKDKAEILSILEIPNE